MIKVAFAFVAAAVFLSGCSDPAPPQASWVLLVFSTSIYELHSEEFASREECVDAISRYNRHRSPHVTSVYCLEDNTWANVYAPDSPERQK